MNNVKEELKNLSEACQEFKMSKFILMEKNISRILLPIELLVITLKRTLSDLLIVHHLIILKVKIIAFHLFFVYLMKWIMEI